MIGFLIEFSVPGLQLRSGEGGDGRMPVSDGLARNQLSGGTGTNQYDPEYARMESWLDEHPDFVQDYFLR